MDTPCKKCGFDIYELIDGHYYCLECHEELENLVDKELDNFENENIIFDVRGGIKQKDSKKEEEKRRAALESKCTSFEEYNYILRGLVDEILRIEKIPNFKKTVLQLWITYLKFSEVAFFDEDNLGHLPKFHAFYRQQDAQILYNKKPVKKKYARKVKPKKDVNIEDDTIETRKLRKRSSRRSLKKIQKFNDESESFVSSNTSTLTNLTLEDIEASMIGQELNIEFSKAGKKTKQKFCEFKKSRGIDVKTNDDGEIDPKMSKFYDQRHCLLVLSGKTILFIIYCALNICGSTIQLSDLLRFARDGHLSYYNIRKLLPERLEDNKLSLTKYHSLCYTTNFSMLAYLEKFLYNFPHIKNSLKVPNLMALVHRYIDDMNLPCCLAYYIEKLMEILPSNLKYNSIKIPNYEGRAMAYILFTIKLIFGLDGYREKEISNSLPTINFQLNRAGNPFKLFNYEAWREHIEYREVILNKYYYPSIFDKDHKIHKPYKSFVDMLNNVNPSTFNTWTSDDKMNKLRRTNIHKKVTTKEFVQRLIDLHDESPTKNLHFECTLTPHKDALRVILESQLESTINTDLLSKNFSEDVLEFYFNPEKLVAFCTDNYIDLATKKATFPKTFSFQKAANRLPDFKRNIKISHDTIDPSKWIKNITRAENIILKEKHEKLVENHHKIMSNVIKKRSDTRKKIQNKNENSTEELDTDEIISADPIDSEDMEVLTFVYPDFNLWHRNMRMHPQCLTSHKEDMSKLPKSLLWLLNVGSKVISQEPELIYFHLMLLEHEFVNVYHPLELTDNELVYKINKTFALNQTMHKFW